MVAVIWTPGTIIPRPGVGFRIINIGQPEPSGAPYGVVAAAFSASWGPLAEVRSIRSITEASRVYGDTAGVEVVKEAIRGGALDVRCIRVGTGGTVPSLNLVDTAGSPITALTITGRSAGTRPIAVTNKVNGQDTSKKDFTVWENVSGVYVLRQVFTYNVSASVEPTNLYNAIVAAGSDWIAAAFVTNGSGVLALVASPTAITGGTNPTIVNADYSTAFDVLGANRGWNELVIDSESTTLQAVVAAYVTNQLNHGNFVGAVIGEPTSVAIATRLTDGRAYNNLGLSYVANGFKNIDGTTIEGWKAAARYAGMISSKPVNRATTHMPVPAAVSIVGLLSDSDLESALNAGLIVFSSSQAGNVWVEQGLTTFNTSNQDYDIGWKKLRRRRTRFQFMQRVTDSVDAQMGNLDNDDSGQNTVIGLAYRIADEMIAERALRRANIYVDPNRVSQGDYAFFVAELVDLDSLEKAHITFAFQFGTV
jgi:tail sheath protein